MTKINHKNWENFAADCVNVDMTACCSDDYRDKIDLRKLNSGTLVVGGYDNDTIYGAKEHINQLYGDGLFDYSGNSSSNYQNITGNDVIYGGNNLDFIHGGLGDDKLYGNGGTNIFQFKSGDGSDTVYMGSGNDYAAFYDKTINQLNLKQNNNDLIIEAGNDKVTVRNYFKNTNKSSFKGILDKNAYLSDSFSSLQNCLSDENIAEAPLKNIIDNFILKEYKDIKSLTEEKGLYITKSGKINGTNASDKICSYSKKDKIFAKDGDDYIKSGGGKDIIYAGYGNDTIYAGMGKDKIYGENGNDFIDGGEDNDTIYSGSGKDTIVADAGNDIIYGYIEKVDDNLLYNDLNNSKFFQFNFGDGKDIIYNSKYSDKININNCKDELIYTKSKNNLVITYTPLVKQGKKTIQKSDTVTVADYFTQGRGNSIANIVLNGQKIDLTEQTIKVSGKKKIYDTEYNDYITGSSKSDTIYVSLGKNEIHSGKGKDKIIVKGGENVAYFNNADGNDTIYFENTIDEICNPFKLDLRFDFYDTEIYFRVKNSDLIIDRKFNKGKKNITESLTLKNINSEILDNVKLNGVDIKNYLNSSTIKVNSYKENGENLYIGSECYKNSIDCTTTGYNYLLGGNKDDCYKLTINKKSIFELEDMGGCESLNINNNVQNIRLLFNVNSSGDVVCTQDYQESEEIYWADSLLIFEKSSLNLKNYNKLTSEKARGMVILKNYFSNDGDIDINNADIETICAKGTELDMKNWINSVAQCVGEWLSDYKDGSYSTFDVLQNGGSDAKELIAIYYNNEYIS